jgi:hypothetical protein
MFCTQCGTEIDQGSNFCKNCGVRIERGAEPVSSDTTGKPAPRREPSKGGRTVVIAVCAALIVLAAGIYFGTDLFQPLASQAPSEVEEPVAKATEAPKPPSFEDVNNPGSAGGNSPASGSTPSPTQPEPLAPAEAPKAPPEILPKSSPEAAVESPSTKSQSQSTGQDAATAHRRRPQPPTPASRAGASPGVYETLRPTPLYENPSALARVVANIPGNTRVSVVSTSGEWLEVHSRRGNPPGFIRRDDATLIEKSN